MKNWKSVFAMALLAVATISLMGCNHRSAGKFDSHDCDTEPDCGCVQTAVQIYIQPFNTYSEADAEAVAQKLEHVTEEIGVPVVAEILPPVRLGDEFKNDAGTRFRANKILDALKKGPKPVIGLIHDDVSTTYKGVDDWGVLGLSYTGKDVCVVSTYRVKNKKEFWKVVYHEFGHSFYGLSHCPLDDPTCIMKDAKGHPRIERQTAICDSCLSLLYSGKVAKLYFSE